MMLKHMYIYLQQVNNEHKYLMLRISERGSFTVDSKRRGKKPEQHRDGDCEDDHDHCCRHIGG